MLQRIAVCILFIVRSACIPTYAQSEIGFFILGGEENANTLAKAYLSPLAKGINNNLGSGWMLGKKNLELGQFTIMLLSCSAWTPARDKTFDINSLSLSTNVQLKNGESSVVPTALGANTAGSALEVSTQIPGSEQEVFLADFHTPEGLGVPAVPLPLLQLHLGVLSGTELMFRILPKINVDYDYANYEAYAWGIGIMQHLSQWVPALEANAIDITFALAYANQCSRGDLRRTQAWYWNHGNITKMTDEQRDPDWYNNQYIDITSASWIVQLLASKSFKAVNVYAGVNYYYGNSSLDTPGRYPQREIRAIEQASYYEFYFIDVDDPIHTHVQSRQLGLVVGLQYRIGKFSLMGEGTYSAYKNLSAGIAFAF